jgi:hypothetical protein
MSEALYFQEGQLSPPHLSLPPGSSSSTRSGSPDAWGVSLRATSSNASSAEFQIPDPKWVRRQAFPASTFATPGMPADYEGAFRTNVRAFLAEFGERDPAREGPPGIATWTLLLQTASGGSFELVIVEENVREARSTHCDHCRSQGEKGVFV